VKFQGRSRYTKNKPAEGTNHNDVEGGESSSQEVVSLPSIQPSPKHSTRRRSFEPLNLDDDPMMRGPPSSSEEVASPPILFSKHQLQARQFTKSTSSTGSQASYKVSHAILTNDPSNVRCINPPVTSVVDKMIYIYYAIRCSFYRR
jgi:hypothetical protein